MKSAGEGDGVGTDGTDAVDESCKSGEVANDHKDGNEEINCEAQDDQREVASGEDCNDRDMRTPVDDKSMSTPPHNGVGGAGMVVAPGEE